MIHCALLLDIRLIDFVLRLPPQPWFDRKYLLRRAMKGALPKPVLTRRKTPAGNIWRPCSTNPALSGLITGSRCRKLNNMFGVELFLVSRAMLHLKHRYSIFAR